MHRVPHAHSHDFVYEVVSDVRINISSYGQKIRIYWIVLTAHMPFNGLLFMIARVYTGNALNASGMTNWVH